MSKTQNKIIVLLSTLMITGFVFLINDQRENSKRINGKRYLIEETDFASMCDKTSDKFKENYADDNYRYQKDGKENQALIDFLDSSDSGKIIDYLKDLAIYLAYMVFGILTIVFWIFYCCYCCCCSTSCCFCCCLNTNNKGKCYDLTVFAIVIILYALIISLSSSALAVSKEFVHGFNGAVCGISKFYFNILNGEEKTTLPKWAGVGNMKNILGQLKGATSVDMMSGSTYALDSNCPKGSCSDSNTTCNILSAEYNSYTEMAGKFSTFTGVSDDGTIINEAADQVYQLNEQLVQFGDMLEMFSDFDSIINDIMSKAFTALFAIITVFVSVQIGLQVLMCAGLCKCGLFRILFNLIWNLVCLLTIFTFILGGVFGIFGSIGHDGAGVFSFVISSENLNSPDPILLGDGEKANDILNECLNTKEGDMAGIVGLRNDKVKNLDGLTDIIASYNKFKGSLKDPSYFGSSTDPAYICQYKIKKDFDDQGGNLGKLAETLGQLTNGDFFSTMKCTFMRKNIDVLLYSFGKELGSKGKTFASLIACVSFFNLFATFFGIAASLRFKELDKEEENKRKENESKKKGRDDATVSNMPAGQMAAADAKSSMPLQPSNNALDLDKGFSSMPVNQAASSNGVTVYANPINPV